jgi:hypothetical protein
MRKALLQCRDPVSVAFPCAGALEKDLFLAKVIRLCKKVIRLCVLS